MLDKAIAHKDALQSTLDWNSSTVRHLHRALVEADYEELAEIGLLTSYAWLDDVLAAMINGAPYVEFETVGPYAVHHLNNSGFLDISHENLPPDEKTGMLIACMWRSITRGLDNVRMVALLDDLSNDFDREFTDNERDRYVVAMVEILRAYGAILPDDVPAKDYLLIRESEMIPEVEQLITRLQKSGVGEVVSTFDGDITFYPTDVFIQSLSLKSENLTREFRRRGILLKRHGRPTCQALDAASFLKPQNLDIVHLVILDKSFISQQHKTFALIRALDITSKDRHHNIFFDSEKLSPNLITYAMCFLIEDQIRYLIRTMDRMDEWEKFDPEEYATRNYGEQILRDDRDIINFVISELSKSHLPKGGVNLVADIGPGPNFYPAMLMAPHLSSNGSIDLIEFQAANRSYLKAMMLTSCEDPTTIWNKFEELMVASGGDEYLGAFEKACNTSNVLEGSIFSLPRDRYDIVSSFFVSESITFSRREFRLAIKSLASAIKPDGILIVAHMIGSREWHAGDDTHFPSVEISETEIEEAYRDSNLAFKLHEVGKNAGKKLREGYRGMAVVVARRR